MYFINKRLNRECTATRDLANEGRVKMKVKNIILVLFLVTCLYSQSPEEAVDFFFSLREARRASRLSGECFLPPCSMNAGNCSPGLYADLFFPLR